MSKANKKHRHEETAVTSGETVHTETPAAPATVPLMQKVEVPSSASSITVEQIEKMTTEEVIASFGNKSNAIRGMSALGMKPGPISKKLGIRYQHARNVLARPLKRVIKEERDAKANSSTEAVTKTQE